MEKIFYPDVEYNRKRRSKVLTLYILLLFLPGGVGVYMFIAGQTTMAIIMVAFVIMLFSMIPTTLQQYPVKMKPLITVQGKTVILGANETFKAGEIEAVSVCIEVPQVSKIKAENEKFLKQVASTYPTEPVLGACDVTVRNAKGKEVVKYAIVSDSIGALEAILSTGVKKYRILYSMKKLSENAQYKIGVPEQAETTIQDLSEKEKMMQLL